MEIRILGPVDVVLDDGRSIPISSRRQRGLLALLAINAPRPVRADVLVDELWAAQSPPSGPNALQVFVSRLRRALGPQAIATDSGGYAANADVDAVHFEHAAADGRDLLEAGDPERAAEALREALALWRGAALSDVAGVPGCEREAARLDELRLRVLEDRISADLDRGRHAEVAAELESLVGEHPFREGLWTKLMLALYRCGRQADALDRAARLRAVLAGELGVDPGPEVQRLEQAILLQKPELDWTPPIPPAPPAPPPPPRRVPEPATSFVGRSGELAELADLVAGHRLVTLTGPAGVGKTRMAVQVAREWDHAWVVELAHLADPALVVQQVAEAMDATTDVASISERLRSCDGLLVLDNCEHLLEACRTLTGELLAAVPRLRVVATSREPLGAAGECTFRVAPLRLPSADAADPLAADAVRLFCERARAANTDLRPAEHAQAVVEVCRRLEGMPLALELAAARSSVLTPRDLLSRLDDTLDVLVTRSETTPRHRTLRAALEWTHDALSDAERETFRRLGVFADGFTLPDAEAVCGREVIDDVERLVAVSLVDTTHAASTMRFGMLASVGALAAEKLREAGETHELRGRHLERMVERFGDTGARVSGPGRSEALEELDAEDGNLRAAVAWGIERSPEEALRLAVALSAWWQLRGRHAETRRWLEPAIAACDPGRSPDVATGLIALGAACMESGDVPAGERYLRAALEAAREVGDERIASRALMNLGAAAVLGNDLESAGELLGQAVDAARATGDDDLAMRALNNLAQVVRRRGDSDGAREMYEQALGFARAAGNEVAEATMLLNIGELDRMAGRLDDARELLDEALEVARGAGYGAAISAALGALGNLAHDMQDLESAQACLTESVEVARELGLQVLVASGVANLAAIAESRGELGEAQERYTEYLRMCRRMGDERGSARAWRGLADVLRASGELRRSARLLGRALGSAAALGERDRIVECLQSVASLAETRGERELAERVREDLVRPNEAVESALAWLAEIAGGRDLTARGVRGARTPTDEALARAVRES